MTRNLTLAFLILSLFAGEVRADPATLGYGPSITVLEDNGGNTFEYHRSIHGLRRFGGNIIISDSCLVPAWLILVCSTPT